MKVSIKIFVSASSIFWASTNLDAQLIKSFGFSLGTSAATHIYEDVPTEYIWGADAGLIFEMYHGQNISLLAEAHFTQKGYSTKSLMEVSTWGGRAGLVMVELPKHVEYLTFPFLGRIGFDAGSITPYFLLGPRIDILLGNPNWRWDWHYPSFSFGMTVGAGFQFPLSSEIRLNIDGRFSPDFTYIKHSDGLYIQNRSFEFLVGFSWAVATAANTQNNDAQVF